VFVLYRGNRHAICGRGRTASSRKSRRLVTRRAQSNSAGRSNAAPRTHRGDPPGRLGPELPRLLAARRAHGAPRTGHLPFKVVPAAPSALLVSLGARLFEQARAASLHRQAIARPRPAAAISRSAIYVCDICMYVGV